MSWMILIQSAVKIRQPLPFFFQQELRQLLTAASFVAETMLFWTW